jgi:predicted  nucleic acid-binding Zn-ribbon protein
MRSTNETDTRRRSSGIQPLSLKAPAVESMPKLSTSTLNPDQKLKAIMQAIQGTNEQISRFQPNVIDASTKSEQLVHRYDMLDKVQEQCSDRLLKIFEEIHAHKHKLATLREQMVRLEDRHNVIINLVQQQVYTATEEEDAAAERLKATRKECAKLVKTINEVNVY